MTLGDKKAKFWRRHIEALQSSDRSVGDYCRKYKINPSTLYAWKKRLAGKPAPKTKQLIPVKVDTGKIAAKGTFVRVILRDGTIVESDGDLSAVARLTDMLRGPRL